MSAIGDPDSLANRFVSTPEANLVAKLTADYGVVFDYAQVDDLELPAAPVPELRLARPATGDGAEEAAGTTAAPAEDPADTSAGPGAAP